VSLHGGRYREPKLKEYDSDTLFGALASLFQPIGMLARRYWEQRTRRRLMLIHLRLREYRLREGRYPDSLEPLNLQELAIDPFTGQPFVYRLIGERYQLESSV
jgi:type II secretory pathway pseudopilin PulG